MINKILDRVGSSGVWLAARPASLH